MTQGKADQLSREAEKARQGKGTKKGKVNDAVVAFGLRSRSVYATPPEGRRSEVIYTYEIPDNCTLESDSSFDSAPVGERRAFEGFEGLTDDCQLYCSQRCH